MRVDPANHPHYDAILAVSAAVLAAERDMDKSIAKLSKLVTTTIETFGDAGLPAAMAQPALVKLVEALAAHVDSRRLLGDAHREYGRTAKRLGASPEAWGPNWPCHTAEDQASVQPPLGPDFPNRTPHSRREGGLMRVDPTNHPHYDAILAVSAAVLTAERDMDKSIAKLSNLVTTTIETYADSKLPAAMAQPALVKLTEALAAHVDSRRLLGEAHREYGRTAKALGVTPESWGPVFPCVVIATEDKASVRPPLRNAA